MGVGVWNGWYHCTGSTYGTWVRGDARGWRTRRHREHVNGDYKHLPAPGTGRVLREQSHRLMKRERVVLSREARRVACDVMVEALQFHEVEVAALCVGAKHWHGLLRFRPLGVGFSGRWLDRDARRLMGIAKKRSAWILGKEGLVKPGGVWGVRCRCRPVKDRGHQVNIARYIWEHRKKGAAVWLITNERRTSGGR